MASRQPRLLPAVHGDRIAGLSFSPNGQLLASASYDGTICLWDVTTGQPRWRVAVVSAPGSRNWLTCVGFSPDGTMIAASADDGVVRFWEAATGRLLQAVQASPQGVFGISFSPDGATLACGSNDSVIRLWDVRPNVPLRQYLQLYRFEGLDLVPVPAVNLYGNGGFRAEAPAAVPRMPIPVPATRPSDQGTSK
jgi:WD40 repeat protein